MNSPASSPAALSAFLKKLKMLLFALAVCFPLAAALAFFALPVGPCRPIVGNGTGLLDRVFVAAILGAGTLGGTAKLKGVLAGVVGGVGGRPTEGVATFGASGADSRGFLNMPQSTFSFRHPYHRR